ncbi:MULTISPECIES: outer membrane protein assembly factor BamC [unclassified Herbaspirillum]|uniref:outer membrane protein assembly factor BamC n=1 Tax=unclassified Herbaspirillum TaxID=2624150 RepID=UPI00114F2791|nr:MULTISPECIES: outer membrane protein assembly factor BamC [unclassified Herbaspirillum]MBB5391940.1 outer membrane protein assembly factor BamC [Herbaspirillum sp. SJZ102]TQK13400.1 Beta-barrel assembly machine subunit BamC [Herbaspirillum sp. SJZ130]TQK15404.1 Beta-barrel assembly machine subunit BamC [Herbaspirillum sp. SJZ106]TWC71299.1 Beta-barrel assembly machine subunit BamC [Herbaspirillum sp. SJZ099]
MTNRKNVRPVVRTAYSTLTQRSIVVALALAALAGCSSVGSILEGDRIDYKSAEKARGPRLEIPPDLTQLQRDNRYAIPEANKGVATASGYTLEQQTKPTAEVASVAPQANGSDIRIERDGTQRWLVVKQSPEVLWPQIKDFWQDSGFLINIESPDTGVMETDWAENRAKIPQDFVRNTLGKVFDSLYSTGERDKFRTRLERGPNGTTEIFISHRGAEEVLTGSAKETSVWTARPSDPGLEAEFLARLMVRLGAEETKAKAAVANAPSLQARSRLLKSAAGSSVQVDESFDRAWRRVGLALDRVGFTVEDRDRTQGTYFVRYVDQNQDAKDKKDQGFFSRIFSSSKDKEKTAAKYRIVVKGSGDSSNIVVQNGEGKPEVSDTADKILGLLNEQLK